MLKFALTFHKNEGGFIDDFLVRGRDGEGVEVSHLLFAGDTLIFCDARKENLEYLIWIVMWLETMSGLIINLEKSELFPIRQVSNLRIFVGTLGCKVGTLLSTYLRLLLGASFKSSRVWNGVEERFWRRLAMWKRQYLSKGGRLTLVKHFV